jgi:hypothetical protein
LLDGLVLADPAPLSDLLTKQMEPLARWLRTAGLAIPPELGGETP